MLVYGNPYYSLSKEIYTHALPQHSLLALLRLACVWTFDANANIFFLTSRQVPEAAIFFIEDGKKVAAA